MPMPMIELLLLIVALAVAGFLAWRVLKPIREVRQDQSHVATLIGTMGGGTVSVREDAVPSPFARRLRAAGIDVEPGLVLAGILVFGILVALLIAMWLPGVIWAYPIFGIVAAWVAWAVIVDIARWRSWKFETRLADAVDLMVGALSAGESPVDAIASAAEGALEPVKTELRGVVQRLQASVPIERAMRPLAERYDCEGVRLFSQLLIAKWEVGGPLAPALQSVNRTIRQGVRLRGQLQTQVANAQNAAIVVAVLPYIVAGIFMWKHPEALRRVLALPWGPHMFMGAVVLQVIGFIWLRKLLRTEL